MQLYQFFLSITLFLFLYLANTSVEREETHYTRQLGGESGEITSLGYPCNYSNNANYTWIIKTRNNRTSVNFTILDLQAETNGIWSCFDYLQVCQIPKLLQSSFFFFALHNNSNSRDIPTSSLQKFSIEQFKVSYQLFYVFINCIFIPNYSMFQWSSFCPLIMYIFAGN